MYTDSALGLPSATVEQYALSLTKAVRNLEDILEGVMTSILIPSYKSRQAKERRTTVIGTEI
jgi:hypothetical protein